MKRSRKVEIALVAALAMAGCGRRAYDPCEPETFNPDACQDAISHNGYYYGGHWYPHSYGGPYSSYYNSYYYFASRGGRSTSVPASAWSRPAGGTSGGATASQGGSVSRGIFGSSAHGSGGGE